MFIDEIGRHLRVGSIPDLERSLKLDRGFWTVVSIREPQVPRPEFLRYAKRYHEVICEDTEQADSSVPSRPPRAEDVEGIFKFVDAYPGEPLLIHCLAGLSRSTAVALAILMRGLIQKGWDPTTPEPLANRAVELLLELRPRARPNLLFLRLCLEQFSSPNQAERLADLVGEHPVLKENRSSERRRTES